MILWEVSLEYAHFNEQPCDDLGEYDIMRSLEYARFNEQAYIKNKKVYG
jgi:hypothetical protein